MKLELSDAMWLDGNTQLSLAQLMPLSGLSDAELRELVECGALVPSNPDEVQPMFGAHWVVAVRTARRLRDDFELDTNALALMLSLLERIRALEVQLREAHAHMPRRSA